MAEIFTKKDRGCTNKKYYDIIKNVFQFSYEVQEDT